MGNITYLNKIYVHKKGAEFCDQNDVLRNLGLPAKGLCGHVK